MAINPYEEGYACCQQSKPWLPARERTVRPKCPYDKASIKSNRWWSGWHAAVRDHEHAAKAPAQPAQVDGYMQLTLFEAASKGLAT